MKIFILFFLTSTIAVAEQLKATEYSVDCKSWSSSTSPDAKVENGFVKYGEARLYFDFKKKLWMRLGANSTVFYKQDGNMNILMGPYLISHQMKYKSEDTIANVIMSMSEIGKEMARKDSQQWRIRSKNGRGEMTYFLNPSEKCTQAPGASFISCRDDKCLMGPRVSNAADTAKRCIKELKLFDSVRTQSVTRACQVFGDEKVYKLIVEENVKANRACGFLESKLLSYAEIKSLCSDALGLITGLK